MGYSAFTKSAGSGYIKYNNGLIFQWGYKTITANTDTVTFPITFPSDGHVLICRNSGNSGNTNVTWYINGITDTSSFDYYSSDSAGGRFSWFAYGI